MLQDLQQRIVGLFLIFLLYLSGLLVSYVAGLPIPGSIIGLLALILILVLRQGRFSSIRSAASLLLPLIPLFLIPICVSMVITVPLNRFDSWKLIALIASSTIVGVILTALTTRFLFRGRSPESR